MDSDLHRLIQDIHSKPSRVMLVAAGAGSQALAWLLGVPGASRTLLEALIPYNESSFDEFLGHKPDQYVAAETAGLLAGRAINRAAHLYNGEEAIVGLSCTATIVTDRPKRGPHRAHVVFWTKERIVHQHLHLAKGARDRPGEEELVSRLIINSLLDAFEVAERLPLELVEHDELIREVQDSAGELKQLFQGQINYFSLAPAGIIRRQSAPPVLLAGSFNPLHQGHVGLAETASAILNQPVTYELTAVNADKPRLSQEETLDRLIQFAGCQEIIVTNAPTFLDKSRLFPGATFVVGYDTASRVLMPRFYGGSEAQLIAALAEISRLSCKFLVAGRSGEDGYFHLAADLPIPGGFEELFQPIPAEQFRLDISSTELRKNAA